MDENVKKCIYILNSLYDNAILIDENLVKTHGNYILYNNTKILANTIRFLEQPKLKAEYVYISDIDIICMDKNICEIHIQHMNEINKKYSNIVRKNTKRLTGLHFSKYDFYYPVNYNEINLSKNDEEVLFDIVSKKCDIDLNTEFRPAHGIHMSPNRPDVKQGSKIPGWNAKPYKQQWNDFIQTSLYKQVEPYFYGICKDQIKKLNDFYLAN